jgi:hypothetical protein
MLATISKISKLSNLPYFCQPMKFQLLIKDANDGKTSKEQETNNIMRNMMKIL